MLADPGPELMFDDRLYKRGALSLHVLRTAVGDEVFLALLRRWVEHHSDGSVTTEDFLDFATAHAGTDITALLAPWLFGTGSRTFRPADADVAGSEDRQPPDVRRR